jgi:hypothetical protein
MFNLLRKIEREVKKVERGVALIDYVLSEKPKTKTKSRKTKKK